MLKKMVVLVGMTLACLGAKAQIPVGPPGGGGGDATLPFPGIVFGTSATTGTVATSNQIQSAIGSGVYAPAPKNIAGLWAFGDSYLFGTGATNPSKAVFSLLALNTPAPAVNLAVPGTSAYQIAVAEFGAFTPNSTIPSIILTDGGANPDDACGGGAGTLCITNFQNSMSFLEAWGSIPYQYRVMASAATMAGGGWVTDTSVAQAPSIYASGTSQTNTTNGSTLTFSIPSSASTMLGISTITDAFNSGTFTVSIDGTLVVNNCSGTTTWSATTCSTIQDSITLGRQRFSVTPNIAHTVIVTNTSSNRISIVSVDWSPPAGTTNANAVFVAGVNSAFGTVYNAASQAVAAQNLADGLQVFFVDLQHGTPGVNNTTDTSTTATATCPASLNANHPNDCGYANFLLTINSTETANNYIFSSLQGGGQIPAVSGDFLGAIRVPGGNNNRPQAYSNFSPSLQTDEVGIDYFVNNQADVGGGFGQDASSGFPFSNQFLYRRFGSLGWDCDQSYDNSGMLGMSHYTSKWCEEFATGNTVQLGIPSYSIGSLSVSGANQTITPTTKMINLSGTGSIQTITLPDNVTVTTGTCLELLPVTGSALALTTGGNLAANLTLVPGAPYSSCYFGTLWYTK